MLIAMVAIGCSALDSPGDADAIASDPGAFVPPPYQNGGPVDAAYGGGASRFRGNPICRSERFACFPDAKCDADAGPPAPADVMFEDAGSPGGDIKACHVRPLGTECLIPGPGLDGATCNTATDCAAGFECVTSDSPSGRCRHYCCDGRASCEGPKQFCDVQPTKDDKDIKVPVCTTVRACNLLQTNPLCTKDEDCTIVDDDDGTTACVTVGTARVGDACNETHCERGLACLGQSGFRTCYQLCDKNEQSTCGLEQKCKGSAPLFRDPNIGICTKI